MKKTLIALAVLATAGTAFAQSSVTLSGVADLNYRNVTSGENKFSGQAIDGLSTSRVALRGVEDLGGGLKANFHFEGAMAPDIGTSAGFNFTRNSTLGLSGAFGEIRLGRDVTPMFYVNLTADPYGPNGLGTTLNLSNSTIFTTPGISAGDIILVAGSFTTAAADSVITNNRDAASRVDGRVVFGDPSGVRANNSVAYYSPDFNGFRVSAMYSFGAENTFALKPVGRMTSFSLTYAQGPVSVAFGNQMTKGGAIASATVVGTDDQKWTTTILAGTYNFGVVRLGYMHRTDKVTNVAFFGDIPAKTQMFSVSAPMGIFTLKAAYATKSVDGDKAGTQVSIGGVYDLSKRTALYATYARLTNEEGFANTIGSAASSTGGVNSKGFEFGIRHNF